MNSVTFAMSAALFNSNPMICNSNPMICNSNPMLANSNPMLFNSNPMIAPVADALRLPEIRADRFGTALEALRRFNQAN